MARRESNTLTRIQTPHCFHKWDWRSSVFWPQYSVPNTQEEKEFKLTDAGSLVYNPVFEDLKYSGHLSLLTTIQHKNAVLGFYQLAEYVERVLNQNNAIYADAVTLFFIDNGLTDFGNSSDSLNAASQSFALDAEPHLGSEEIIFANNQNKELTLGLHNKLAIRGRSSSIHIDLLNRLQSEGESVIDLLSN